MNRPAVDRPGEAVRLEGFTNQDLYQHREKIFTRFVGGFYQRLRFFTGWPLLVGYFAVPWLMWDDRQAVLFDLSTRQFHLFDLTVWPQDLWLLGWLLMTAAFALFAVTTVVGRLWCGYTCPQTVWTAIFMWMEQVAEGSRHQRIRLESAPWSFDKVRKRLLKHGMWFGWALLTGATFVGYFVPMRELADDLITLQLGGGPLLWVAVFTAATYFNAGWLREQVCIYMCPYARFQSAMIDSDTLVVAYDVARGEPRRSRTSDLAATGDCINCTLCVQVCPTGIDIRDGLQYECIGCAHCIDACNQVMTQTGSTTGLIRYSTTNEVGGIHSSVLRPRSIGYAVLSLVLAAASVYFLTHRATLTIDVLRERGQLYGLLADGTPVNEYQLKILNKTQAPATLQIDISSAQPLRLLSQPSLRIEANSVLSTGLRVAGRSTAPIADVTVGVCATPGERCARETTRFFAPATSGGVR